ncbi:unnamed protein product [Durusdinium trenchii]|uniref:Uncharacterized protein n=1 Tax=Durusdinium trenchii TaxID=1381693 RepID=A0ABP0NL05_9DINO
MSIFQDGEGLASRTRLRLHECFDLLAETVQVLGTSPDPETAQDLATQYASRITSVRQELMEAIDATEEDAELKSRAASQAHLCSDLRYQARCAEERLRLSKRLQKDFPDFAAFVADEDIFIEPVTRANRAAPGSHAGLLEAGYLNGVAHGGSSSSTASAAQGSRLSKSGSAPSLVEAAAVKLENQRLREEIRAMCNTIKYQSSQLSALWAETNKLQARQKGPGGVSKLMAGVAELSRMRLEPGSGPGERPSRVSGMPGMPGMPRARSAGSLRSSADSDTGRCGPGALGQPTQLHVPYPSQPDVSRASNGCGERAREMGRQLAAGQNGTLAGARASCQKIPNFPDDPLQDGDVVA